MLFSTTSMVGDRLNIIRYNDGDGQWPEIDKGSEHDAIGNCFLNTSRFYDKDNDEFEGDIKLKNVKTGSINVSVQGRLIIPKELEIRCDNLTKLKADQLKITDKQS